MSVRIADLPAHERPRERLRRVGAGGLSDCELIALVLRSGGAGRSAVEVAQDLVAAHGSLTLLSVALVEQLAATSSVGEAKAAGLVAAFELGRRAVDAAPLPDRIRSAEDLVALFRGEFKDHRREEALVAVLDASRRPLRVVMLTVGGPTAASFRRRTSSPQFCGTGARLSQSPTVIPRAIPLRVPPISRSRGNSPRPPRPLGWDSWNTW